MNLKRPGEGLEASAGNPNLKKKKKCMCCVGLTNTSDKLY